MHQIEFRNDLIQGSEEWHALRKTKITATDACIIMGVSHWKTRTQLYHEKLSNNPPTPPNERMQRGTDLEPLARDLFCMTTGHKMVPKVVVKDWAMASLDGINNWNEVLEIKCPGEKDHAIAISGKVPDHYYPQLQHQMYVCNSDKAFYYSFDGIDGVTVEIERDNEYIEKMITEEFKFFMCLQEKKIPEPSEGDYVEREDDLWKKYASKWISINQSIKSLEQEEQELRSQLILLSGESNSKGAGIALCQYERKGNVDYSKIEVLKSMNLEPYRKPSTKSWRINSG